MRVNSAVIIPIFLVSLASSLPAGCHSPARQVEQSVELDAVLETTHEAREAVFLTDDAVTARKHARLAFAEALARSLNELEGQVYEIELEMDDNRPTYETALMTLGRFFEIEVDAETGEVIEIEDETAIR